MKKNLKQLIRTELNEKYESKKAFEYLILCEDDDDKFYLFVNYLEKVITENKTSGEMISTISEHYSSSKKLINEQEQSATGTNGNVIMDFFGKLFNAAKEQGGKAMDGEGFFGTTAGESIMSQALEWIIEKVLNVVGFKGDLAKVLATTLSEIHPKDFIVIFKDSNNCAASMTNISTAVAEGWVRHLTNENLEDGHAIADTIRNYLFELVKKGDFGKIVGVTLCKGIDIIKEKIPLILSRFK